MKIISTALLRELEVINLCGGEKLGYPCDLEVDVETATVVSLIVSRSEGIPFFGKREEYVIPWRKIHCIGEDAILVKIDRDELVAFQKSCKTKKRK